MTTLDIAYSQTVEGLGRVDFVPFSLERYGEKVYSWVTQPYAVYWGMNDQTFHQFKRSYVDLLLPDHYHAFIGLVEGVPSFLMEQYDPAQDILNKHFHIEQGDVGMHILVAPPTQKISGFTWKVFSSVLDFIFSDTNHLRVIVEPDARNEKIHTLNKRAGFHYHQKVDLPHKTAWIATCARNDFAKAKTLEVAKQQQSFLPPAELWAKANLRLVTKSISEFCHELILSPQNISDDEYSISTTDGQVQYLFKAQLFALEHWDVSSGSIRKIKNYKEAEINMLDFILEFRDQLNIPEEFLSTYLEEITSTLYSLAYKYCFEKHNAKELAHQDFQTIEHAMIEGHPCFIANSGRIGFSSTDFKQYAPEADSDFSLVWIAGHKSCCTFTSTPGLDYGRVITQELDQAKHVVFVNHIESLGLDIEDYTFIPVHPWQWTNKISLVFADDIAKNNLVYLGKGNDKYSPQQSIRTLYNTSNPSHYYVKTAMSILNMGFVRGLSAHYMKSTPPITNWINNLLLNDPILKAQGFDMLGEVATVGFESATYKELGYRHINNKMLAALWRESPDAKLVTDEKAMTMAALLHVDQSEDALLPHIIKASGLTPKEWVNQYLQAYLVPLIHSLYQYRLVFMPHGENIILKMKNHVPCGIFMKDITEEVILFDTELELPEHVDRLQTSASNEMQALSLHTDVFDCFFRFLTVILEKHCDYPADEFWTQVNDVITDYQNKHPELEKTIEELDLLKEEFKRCCLNRLQLSNTKQMLNLSDPINSLKLEGHLKNPLAQTLHGVH